ncbi:MAG TPA: Hsp20/alpha crystallin family protein [Planctomycetota bacterium]|nr:Hsp20/alpha crystallin family protein [Planctomycetota bacterium]
MPELAKWDPIARWDPWKELEEMSSRLNRYFGKKNGEEESLTVAEWAPAVDVSETEKEFVIKAELPEVKKEDVKVTVEDGILTIQGERKQEKEEKGKKFHRIERSYGSFVRSFTLPDEADATKVAAEVKDGMLNIRLPKTEKPKAKATEVKIS